MKEEVTENKIPEIYCAVVISFERDTCLEEFLFKLKKIGITQMKIHKPKYALLDKVSIAIVNYEPFWYLDDALTKMFAKIANIEELKNIIKYYNGKCYIDVAYYQYGTCPVILFSGDNMKKIRFLEADISIDPYVISN